MNKYLVIAVFAAILLAAAGQASAAAGGVTLDGSLVYGTAPVSGYDSTVGIGVGALLDMSGRFTTSSKDMKVGIRADMTYFDWGGSFYGVDVSYKRLMLFGGPRISFQPGGRSNITPYVEGGLELGYGRSEVYLPYFGTSSTTDINLGLAGGGGVDFALAKNLKLGINGRLHLISDSFLTLGVTLGLAF